VSRFCFDIETNGLLDQLNTVHSLVLKDVDTGEVLSCADQPNHIKNGFGIEDGVKLLAQADEIIGHNIIKFDIPALQKVYPAFAPKGKVTDTLVCSRVIWPELREDDFRFIKRPRGRKFPRYLIGSHSLEAWGQRLGFPKDDYAKRCKDAGIDPWAEWSPMMQDYCVIDVEVTAKFLALIEGKKYSQEALELEHQFAHVMWEMEKFGFPFDRPAAETLYNALVTRAEEIAAELRTVFKPRWFAAGVVTPKVGDIFPKSVRRKMEKGYKPKRSDLSKTKTVKDCPYTKVVLTEFNPSSRQHIATWLKDIHGWEPSEYTKGGQPKVDDEVLAALDYPEAKLLTEYLLVNKRLGQIGDGRNAWLKLERDGRIHGEIVTNGAVTGRCTHKRPNMAQVPSLGAKYGKECRSLFGAFGVYAATHCLLGADASGLELRALAHFMARYDDGAYAKVILEGDVHWTNAIALGLIPVGTEFDPHNEKHNWARNVVAKRFIYAFLYGAGDEKLGSIVGGGRKEGARLKATFLKSVPALARLRKRLEKVVKAKGHIVGLDGRHLPIRSQHAALNTLLQSAGAVAVKKATVLLWQDLSTRGYTHGVDYGFVAHVHDEFQMLVKNELAEEFQSASVAAFRSAGAHFNFRCPLDGQAQVGRTWADTH
jgi:DNA polymerase I-like protein with 3'-5' exonuclease and polymerase domains